MRQGCVTIANAGRYIHIPFCVKKCAYCYFYSTTDLSLRDAYLEGLVREMQLIDSPPFTFDTIYLGGGTPSVLTPLPEVELSTEMLADLPPELAQELHQTTRAADREATLAVIEQIEGEAPETAAGLRTLVENFQLGRLRELLKDSNDG
jgi:coproporphyrinogen III oxidase-like Fe-S oxidoreductase